MTGIEAFSASSFNTLCSNTRATIPCTQRSRFLATSLTVSRSPRRDCVWSRNTAPPPMLAMPTSNVTRVRSDGFSKIIARKRPASALRPRLNVGRKMVEFANLRRAPFGADQQIVRERRNSCNTGVHCLPRCRLSSRSGYLLNLRNALRLRRIVQLPHPSRGFAKHNFELLQKFSNVLRLDDERRQQAQNVFMRAVDDQSMLHCFFDERRAFN